MDNMEKDPWSKGNNEDNNTYSFLAWLDERTESACIYACNAEQWWFLVAFDPVVLHWVGKLSLKVAY